MEDFKEKLENENFLTYKEVDVPQEDLTMNTMNTTLFKQKYLEGDGKLDSTLITDKKVIDAVQEEKERDRNSDI